MEFRLSENTVNNYTEYTTERARYAGSDGADGGNWTDLKQFLVSQNFSCNWSNRAGQQIPIKGGSTALGQVLTTGLQDTVSAYPGVVYLGIVDGSNDEVHTNAEGSETVWYRRPQGVDDVGWGQDTSGRYDNAHILLVRPL